MNQLKDKIIVAIEDEIVRAKNNRSVYIDFMKSYRNKVDKLMRSIDLYFLDVKNIDIIDVSVTVSNHEYEKKTDGYIDEEIINSEENVQSQHSFFTNFMFVFTVYDENKFSMYISFSNKGYFTREYNCVKPKLIMNESESDYILKWNISSHSLNVMKNDTLDHYRNIPSYVFLNQIY